MLHLNQTALPHAEHLLANDSVHSVSSKDVLQTRGNMFVCGCLEIEAATYSWKLRESQERA